MRTQNFASISSHYVPLPRHIFCFITSRLHTRYKFNHFFFFLILLYFKTSSQISPPHNRILSNMQCNAFFVLYSGRCTIFFFFTKIKHNALWLFIQNTWHPTPFSRRHSTISPSGLIFKKTLHDTSIHESSPLSSSHLPLTQ